MRRLTCTEGGSSKFWEGAVEGNVLVVRFGKLGTEGQVKKKPLADAAAAERELAKLVAEKLHKGYEDDKASKAKAAAGGGKPEKQAAAGGGKPEKKPAAAKVGPYLASLVEAIQKGKKRKKPLEEAVELLAKPKLAADLRVFLEAVAAHEIPYIAVGEYWLEADGVGQRVPKPDDDDEDRDDVLAIGNSPGGDPWVVDVDATGKKAWITRIVHDDGWSEGEAHEGFEEFLSELASACWQAGEDTHLDAGLAKRGVEIEIDQG